MKNFFLPTCRKACFFSTLFFLTLKINAQSYFISFAGTGATTTVDSVKVENLTHAATVKLAAGDILHLFGTDGINEINVNDESIQIKPNPTQGQADISFYAKESGVAQLSIYDISGRKIIQISDNFLQGIQKYQLSGLSKGMYSVNVTGGKYFYTAKLISLNTSQSEAKIKYLETSAVNGKQEIVVNRSKSTKATIPMAYVTGDNLRFTGYSCNTSVVVNDVPTGSKTITFTFDGITASISGTTTICAGGNATLTASGGGSYMWNTNATTAAITVNPGTTTTYTVTVSGGACTATASTTVNVSSSITASISGTTTICTGDNTMLTASGGSSYLWNTSATTASITVNPGTTTPYTVTVSDGASCTATTSATVTVNSVPTASISGIITICAGGHTTLSAHGGGTYLWNTNATTAAITINPVSTITYIVTVTNAAACIATASAMVTVNHCNCPTTINDIDGNTYNVLTLGSQCWMKENLKTTKYNNNIAFPNVTDATTWANSSNSSIGVYCDYNNTPSNGVTYGHLYNWYAATDARNICPVGGWHVPANAEWTTLQNFLVASGYNYDGTTSGNKIGKAMASSTGWTFSSVAGVVGNTDYPDMRNASGFSALPGGDRTNTGDFESINRYTYWWLSDGDFSLYGQLRFLALDAEYLIANGAYKTSGFSVRCVKDTGMVASVSGASTICPFDNATLTASGGGTYLWNTNATTAAITVNPGTTTIYTVTVTNGANTATASATITVPLIASISGTTEICNGANTTLTASGGSSYLWSTTATTAAITVNPSTATIYTVTVSSETCTASASTMVTILTNCCLGTPIVSDYDGNIYNTIKIGDQCWMKENLKTTHYSNGSGMVNGSNAGDISGDFSTKYYFDYNDDPANTIIYGKLYTWAAVMNGAASSNSNPSGVQGPCPTGWHIPSDAEWTMLTDYLINNGYGYSGTGDQIGKSMAAKSGWTANETPGSVGNDQASNNSSGFTALPVGIRLPYGPYVDLSIQSYWWSSNESDTYPNTASVWFVRSYTGDINFEYDEFYYGVSVRCLKD